MTYCEIHEAVCHIYGIRKNIIHKLSFYLISFNGNKRAEISKHFRQEPVFFYIDTKLLQFSLNCPFCSSYFKKRKFILISHKFSNSKIERTAHHTGILVPYPIEKIKLYFWFFQNINQMFEITKICQNLTTENSRWMRFQNL